MCSGGGGSKPPPPPKPPPRPVDPSVLEARRNQRLEAARKRGRAATILTGGQGVTTAPNLGAVTLLGR